MVSNAFTELSESVYIVQSLLFLQCTFFSLTFIALSSAAYIDFNSSVYASLFFVHVFKCEISSSVFLHYQPLLSFFFPSTLPDYLLSKAVAWIKGFVWVELFSPVVSFYIVLFLYNLRSYS